MQVRGEWGRHEGGVGWRGKCDRECCMRGAGVSGGDAVGAQGGYGRALRADLGPHGVQCFKWHWFSKTTREKEMMVFFNTFLSWTMRRRMWGPC